MRADFAVLLASTILATAASAAPVPTHKGPPAPARPRGDRALTLLYDQTSTPSGIGVVSQNFEASFDAYDCMAADDFIVPEGAVWKIKEVDITGTYFDGSGPSRAQSIVFYKTARHLPGKEIVRFDGMEGDDHLGSFVIDLGKGVRLRPGHYWLSAQSTQDFISGGEWGWEASSVRFNARSAWRNPGGGFQTDCTDWGVEFRCLNFDKSEVADHLFALRGHAI